MLPDLDDEQRVHLAHEHPTDLDSGTSSPSSGTPKFYDNRRRPKSAAHHRSHTATDGSSSNSHLLARLVSAEEQVREINSALAVTTERLEAESSRANAAERRALDYFHRLRIATENRERSEQDVARLREELKLYKLQLENAQKEIFRAQDIIDQVAAQRNEAEAEAARARTKARKLQEEKLVMLAREEGRRMGYQEGLSMGRRIGYDEEHDDDDENVLEPGEAIREERNDPTPRVQLRSNASIRQPSVRSESAPPVRTMETPSPGPPIPIRVHTPSHEHHTHSPPGDTDGPETIRPIPIRPSPIISTQPISVPLDDGWIPRADSRTSYIAMPSPHKLQPPIPASPNTITGELQDNRATPQLEPTPVPPPVRSREYAYQASAPPSVPRGHTPSLASRASSHFSQYDLLNKRPGSSLRNEIYLGRAGSGGRPSRASTSRNGHRDPERRRSSRTEAEAIAEQWREDSDADSPPQNPPRTFTPAPIPHPHRPPHFYYRPRENMTPTPLGDVDDSRTRTPVPTEATAARLQPPADDPASNPARTRAPLEYLRKRFRQRPGSGGSGSIPNIVVESPSEPETTIPSPSAPTATQPELLSPEAANRPLPQEDPAQHQHQHQHYQRAPQSQSYSQSQSQPQSHRHYQTPSYDTAARSGSPYPPWPAGFVPYPPGGHGTASSSSNSRSGPERDRERDRDRDNRRAYTQTAPPPYSNSNRNPHVSSDLGRSQNGYARARTQSASSSMGRAGSGYETAPLPQGVMYPAPPARSHTSHRGHRDRDRDREREREWERTRDVHDWDWEQERDRVRDRDGRRRDSARDYDMEQDPQNTGFDELTRSPAPLQRPISLFDSDEA